MVTVNPDLPGANLLCNPSKDGITSVSEWHISLKITEGHVGENRPMWKSTDFYLFFLLGGGGGGGIILKLNSA